MLPSNIDYFFNYFYRYFIIIFLLFQSIPALPCGALRCLFCGAVVLVYLPNYRFMAFFTDFLLGFTMFYRSIHSFIHLWYSYWYCHWTTPAATLVCLYSSTQDIQQSLIPCSFSLPFQRFLFDLVIMIQTLNQS